MLRIRTVYVIQRYLFHVHKISDYRSTKKYCKHTIRYSVWMVFLREANSTKRKRVETTDFHVRD